MQGQPIRGLRGQSMRGSRTRSGEFAAQPVYVTGTASGTITIRKSCIALMALWGGGGTGSNLGVNGGGGGAAAYARVPLLAGQTISYVSGAAEVDSTVTLPDGRIVRAGAGGVINGGVATGGDINRRGGNGGSGANSGSPGEGPGAGAGGTPVATRGGGGGAAGLADVLPDFLGGAGGIGDPAPASEPGGGTGAHATPNAGANGRVIIVFVSLAI